MDLESAQVHVTHGQQDLLKYWQSVSNNRWFILKSFAVLMLFIVLFSVLFT